MSWETIQAQWHNLEQVVEIKGGKNKGIIKSPTQMK